MAIGIKGPAKYVQGRNILPTTGLLCANLGSRFYLLCSENTKRRYGAILEKSFKDESKDLVYGQFTGKCTKNVIYNCMQEVQTQKCDVVIGMGGGKALDTAKAVADNLGGLPVVMVPTIASNDAPCSGVAVIYSEEGEVKKALFTRQNPDLVLVDTQIIADAPPRFLAAGIGDALSTYYEVKAVKASGALTFSGGTCSNTAYALAKLCHEILINDGIYAYCSAKNHLVTKALDNVIEATIYLSGLGFESGGIAAAHAIHDGLARLPETKDTYHGEKVAFGTICQLILENEDPIVIEKLLHFLIKLDLPVTLQQLGLSRKNHEALLSVAQTACAPEQFAGNMPFTVNPCDIYDAMLFCDTLGESLINNRAIEAVAPNS